jgi:hypothetical protein
VLVLPAQVELIEKELRDLLQWASMQPLDVRLQVVAMLMQWLMRHGLGRSGW